MKNEHSFCKDCGRPLESVVAKVGCKLRGHERISLDKYTIYAERWHEFRDYSDLFEIASSVKEFGKEFGQELQEVVEDHGRRKIQKYRSWELPDTREETVKMLKLGSLFRKNNNLIRFISESRKCGEGRLSFSLDGSFSLHNYLKDEIPSAKVSTYLTLKGVDKSYEDEMKEVEDIGSIVKKYFTQGNIKGMYSGFRTCTLDEW